MIMTIRTARKREPQNKGLAIEHMSLTQIVEMLHGLNNRRSIEVTLRSKNSSTQINPTPRDYLIKNLEGIRQENLAVPPTYRPEICSAPGYVNNRINLTLKKPQYITLNGVVVKECTGIQINYRTSLQTYTHRRR